MKGMTIVSCNSRSSCARLLRSAARRSAKNVHELRVHPHGDGCAASSRAAERVEPFGYDLLGRRAVEHLKLYHLVNRRRERFGQPYARTALADVQTARRPSVAAVLRRLLALFVRAKKPTWMGRFVFSLICESDMTMVVFESESSSPSRP